jgi:thiamine-phosphate pyrophosphorylase
VLRYAITPGLLPDGTSADVLVTRAGELARQGVEFLLVREKRLADLELFALMRTIREATAGTGMKVLLAGRAELALAAGADGVHLGSRLEELASARRAFPQGLLSVSCHTVDEVFQASAAGADLLLFAPVFGKRVDGVEVVPGTGLEALQKACAAAGEGARVFALGGVTAVNAAECVAAGASGVAGIRLFFG